MRNTVIIFSVLVAQGSASFFSELSNSLTTVGVSVEKLISDAASDIKDTVECTVFAVQQAFNVDTEGSGYEKCQTKKPENAIPVTLPRPVTIYTSSVIQPPAPVWRSKKLNNIKQNNAISTQKVKNTKDFSKQEKGVQSVESSSESETRLLAKISSKFERELDDLSKHVDDDFAKNKYNIQLYFENVIKEIDKLYVEEEIHQNNTDAEIREIFEMILSKLEKNNLDNFDLRSEIKLALAESEYNKNKTNKVKNDLEQWRKEGSKELNDIKYILKENKQNTTISQIKETQKATERPTSAATSPTAETVSSTVTVTTTEATTPAAQTTIKPTIPSKTTPAPSIDESLVNRDQNTLELAKKLIVESRKQAALMHAILKDINKTAVENLST